MSRLLQFCDLKFELGPQAEQVDAHIPFVAARSPYLKDRVKEVLVAQKRNGDQSRANISVALPDVDVEAFKLVGNSNKNYYHKGLKLNASFQKGFGVHLL